MRPLAVQQEGVEDKGIRAVRYSLGGLETYRIHAKDDPEEIASVVYEHALGFFGPHYLSYYPEPGIPKPKAVNNYKLRETLTGMIAGTSRANHGDVVFETTPTDERKLTLKFGKKIVGWPDSVSEIEAPEGVILVEYEFLFNGAQNIPSQAEIELLNALSRTGGG